MRWTNRKTDLFRSLGIGIFVYMRAKMAENNRTKLLFFASRSDHPRVRKDLPIMLKLVLLFIPREHAVCLVVVEVYVSPPQPRDTALTHCSSAPPQDTYSSRRIYFQLLLWAFRRISASFLRV